MLVAVAAGFVAMVIVDVAAAQPVGTGTWNRIVAARTLDFPEKGSLSTAELRSLAFAGGRRKYLIQPVRLAGRHPVVIVLHGGNSDFKTVWTETSLPTLGARFGFLVVAPNASMNRHWNDGRNATGEGQPSTADDVGYLKALISDVVTHADGDPSAIFMVGVSNGGFMTIRFACEAGRLLRAGANVVSNIPTKQMALCKIGKPLPWLSINGDRDPRVLFNGYPAGTKILGRAQPGLVSATRTFTFFADNAKCASAVRIEAIPHISSSRSTALKRIRNGCAGETTSTQYVLHSAGHTWPGLFYSANAALKRGGVNEDVDAGTVIWMHFRQTLNKNSYSSATLPSL